MTPVLHSIAEAWVARMVLCVVEGSAIAIFGWLLLRAFPRLSAKTRFAMWMLILFAIAITPFEFASQARTSSAHSWLTLPRAWAVYIFAAWAAIASLSLARVMLGLTQLWRLRRECAQVDIETLPIRVREALAQSGRNNVALLTSDRLQVPTAIGFFRPAIVIPDWLIHEMSAEELEHVVMHEASHLRRRDDWTNLAQKLLKAILFFQPLVWWVDAQLHLQREIACDDLVLRQTGNARGYAECLASLAEKSYLRRTMLLAQAAVSRVRQVSARVLHILQSDAQPGAAMPHNSQRRWQPALCGTVMLGAIAALSVWQAPQVISFNDAVPVAVNVPAVETHRDINVIPAAMKVESESLPGVVKLSVPAKNTKSRRASQPRITKPQRLMAINAAEKLPPQPTVKYQTVVWFVQSTTSDAAGQVYSSWTLCVWHIASPEAASAASNPRKVI